MKRTYLYAIVALIIIAVVVVLVFSTNSGLSSGEKLASFDNKPVPASLLAMLRIPDSVSNQVGAGVAEKYVTPLNAPALTLNGKPEILYIGAEYCPFCAAQRWPMVIALMRFGNFTNLSLMTSDHNDYSPDTPTFTFYNSTYTSPYISFVSVEQTTNTRTALQQMNDSQLALFAANDPNGGIPFILFANRSVWINADYDPLSVLGDKNWTVIAAQLQNSSSVQAEAIVGTANLMTAQICIIDNNTPTSVCSQPYVRNLEGAI